MCEFIKDVLETEDISRDVGETCERFRTWFERRCTRNRGHFERCGRQCVNASERGLSVDKLETVDIAMWETMCERFRTWFEHSH